MGFVPGVLAGHEAGGNCYMGWAGATWAVAHLRPLRHVSFLSALVGPGTGSLQANKDVANPHHIGRTSAD